jgi:ABC-type Fe3+-citrate transport system substrate-binding protein
MKKVTFILTIGVLFTLMSCGSESTTTQTTDSTTVQSDTTTVSTDSTVSGVPVEATELHSDVENPTSNQEVK